MGRIDPHPNSGGVERTESRPDVQGEQQSGVADASMGARVRVIVTVVGRSSRDRTQRVHQLWVPPKVDEAIQSLLPQLKEYLPAETLQTCLVVVNGRSIRMLDPNTLLQDGDEVAIILPVAGGSA